MISERVLNDFNNKKVLITGGTGLIGREIANILCDAGSDVTVVSLDNIKINKNVKHIHGDLRDFNFCKDIFKFPFLASLIDSASSPSTKSCVKTLPDTFTLMFPPPPV